MTDDELDELIERMKATDFDDLLEVFTGLKVKLPADPDLELLMEFAMMGLGNLHAARDSGLLDAILSMYKVSRRNRLN